MKPIGQHEGTSGALGRSKATGQAVCRYRARCEQTRARLARNGIQTCVRRTPLARQEPPLWRSTKRPSEHHECLSVWWSRFVALSQPPRLQRAAHLRGWRDGRARKHHVQRGVLGGAHSRSQVEGRFSRTTTRGGCQVAPDVVASTITQLATVTSEDLTPLRDGQRGFPTPLRADIVVISRLALQSVRRPDECDQFLPDARREMRPRAEERLDLWLRLRTRTVIFTDSTRCNPRFLVRDPAMIR